MDECNFPSNLNFRHTFDNKPIRLWTGRDSYEWARAEACNEGCAQRFNMEIFGQICGENLLHYKEEQFQDFLNDRDAGQFFYRQFQQTLLMQNIYFELRSEENIQWMERVLQESQDPSDEYKNAVAGPSNFQHGFQWDQQNLSDATGYEGTILESSDDSATSSSGRLSSSSFNDDGCSYLRKTKSKSKKKNRKRGPFCWEFLLRLLKDPSKNPSWIKWLSGGTDGVFQLVEKEKIAQMWGQRSGKVGSYTSLARGLRYHYGASLLPVSERQVTYKFPSHIMNYFHSGSFQ